MKQYFHQQYNNRFTMSLEVPEKAIFEDLIKLGSEKTIWLETGIAYVHPQDQFYVKAIGREIADVNTQRIQYELKNIHVQDDSLTLTLNSADTYNIIIIDIKLLPKATRAHFIHAELR